MASGQSFKGGAGLFGATDGTQVWLFCINTDAANSVLTTRFNGSSWTPWSAVANTASGSQSRNFLAGAPRVANNQIGLIWTEGTGPYTIAATSVAVTTVAPPAPTVTLSASPASIVSGSASTLTWSATNATSTSINQGVGTVASSGTQSVSPTATTTYTITATNATGSATATATVTVTATAAATAAANGHVVGVAGFHYLRRNGDADVVDDQRDVGEHQPEHRHRCHVGHPKRVADDHDHLHADRHQSSGSATATATVTVTTTTTPHNKARANSYDDAWQSGTNGWVANAKAILAAGTGQVPGMVMWIGDSLTRDPALGTWAQSGAGKTVEDQAITSWMHAGQSPQGIDSIDGFALATPYFCSARSYTVGDGLGSWDFMGGSGMPPDTNPTTARQKLLNCSSYPNALDLTTMLAALKKPQFAIPEVNLDAGSPGQFPDLQRMVNLMISKGIVPIIITYTYRTDAKFNLLVDQYNAALVQYAQTKKLPLIDLNKEMLAAPAVLAVAGPIPLGRRALHLGQVAIPTDQQCVCERRRCRRRTPPAWP